MIKSEAQKRAVAKYVKNNYDKILVIVPKGDRDAIKEAAARSGMSLNAFIVQAIKEKMM